jgi:hypothetical protein
VYPLRYSVESRPGGWRKEELGEDGGADAVIIVSLIFGEDGSRSEMTLSLDGRTKKQLPDIELFKTWVGFAYQLQDSPTLSPAARAICRLAYMTVREDILGNRT